MGDWERSFGEDGMRDGFIEAEIGAWGDRLTRQKVTLLFQTSKDASNWAKEHPGSSIVRHPTKNGWFMSRTWMWDIDEGGLGGISSAFFGTEANMRADMREIRTRRELIKYATACMKRRSDVAAQWLYHNGHRQLILDECLKYCSNIKLLQVALFEIDEDFGRRLESLLPPNIDTMKEWEIPLPDRFDYQVKTIMSGWIGE